MERLSGEKLVWFASFNPPD